MAYNTSHTRRKSTLLYDLDCRTTGSVKYAEGFGVPIRLVATVTTDEIIEQGECISMLRVPRGFTVTGGQLAWTAASTDAVVGVGDPFCCARFMGPIEVRHESTSRATSPSGTTCYPNSIITKVGRLGDGCGLGYTFTCETDVLVTNLYGPASAGNGGGGVSSASSGGNSGTLPLGIVFTLILDGVQNATTTNLT